MFLVATLAPKVATEGTEVLVLALVGDALGLFFQGKSRFSKSSGFLSKSATAVTVHFMFVNADNLIQLCGHRSIGRIFDIRYWIE
jgi:hypothetical protein